MCCVCVCDRVLLFQCRVDRMLSPRRLWISFSSSSLFFHNNHLNQHPSLFSMKQLSSVISRSLSTPSREINDARKTPCDTRKRASECEVAFRPGLQNADEIIDSEAERTAILRKSRRRFLNSGRRGNFKTSSLCILFRSFRF